MELIEFSKRKAIVLSRFDTAYTDFRNYILNNYRTEFIRLMNKTTNHIRGYYKEFDFGYADKCHEKICGAITLDMYYDNLNRKINIYAYVKINDENIPIVLNDVKDTSEHSIFFDDEICPYIYSNDASMSINEFMCSSSYGHEGKLRYCLYCKADKLGKDILPLYTISSLEVLSRDRNDEYFNKLKEKANDFIHNKFDDLGIYIYDDKIGDYYSLKITNNYYQQDCNIEENDIVMLLIYEELLKDRKSIDYLDISINYNAIDNRYEVCVKSRYFSLLILAIYNLIKKLVSKDRVLYYYITKFMDNYSNEIKFEKEPLSEHLIHKMTNDLKDIFRTKKYIDLALSRMTPKSREDNKNKEVIKSENKISKKDGCIIINITHSEANVLLNRLENMLSSSIESCKENQCSFEINDIRIDNLDFLSPYDNISVKLSPAESSKYKENRLINIDIYVNKNYVIGRHYHINEFDDGSPMVCIEILESPFLISKR